MTKQISNRLNKLETRAGVGTFTRPPFSHSIITALLDGTIPEGWTPEQWAASQAETGRVFNFGALENLLGGRHEQNDTTPLE